MKHILFIDTSSNKKISVVLKINNTLDKIEQEITLQKAQVVLLLIDQLLKKHKLQLKDIDAIEVNTGPGSFTGLRVGIAIANALGFTLNVPVNNKPVGTFVRPTYE